MSRNRPHRSQNRWASEMRHILALCAPSWRTLQANLNKTAPLIEGQSLLGLFSAKPRIGNVTLEINTNRFARFARPTTLR
jgi:hypothetical protein